MRTTITITLHAGPNRDRLVSRADVQRNIDALMRVTDASKLPANDYALLVDTRSILEAIKQQLKA